MVKIKESEYLQEDGSMDIQAWLHHITQSRQGRGVKLIGQACQLSQLTGGDHRIAGGQTTLQQGLKMAEILVDLEGFQSARKITWYDNFSRPLPDILAIKEEKEYVVEVKSYKAPNHNISKVFQAPNMLDLIIIIEPKHRFYSIIKPEDYFTDGKYRIKPRQLKNWKKF